MLTMSHSIQEKNCKDNTVGRFRKFEFMFVGWTQALYPLTYLVTLNLRVGEV